MASTDFFIKPFSNTTKTKLLIFKEYAEVWIPTFIMSKSTENLHIFDFFSGPGYDNINQMGSPILLLNIANKHFLNLITKGKKIVFHFNAFKRQEYQLLIKNVTDFIKENSNLSRVIEIHYYNQNFEKLFPKLISEIEKNPSLVYIDQFGVKYFSAEYITKLSNLDKTDFLYFVASSCYKRFGETAEFQKFMNFSFEELNRTKFPQMHRLVIEKLKQSIPENSKLMMFPFSLKKDANYYGIIFGAKHLKAVDTFLGVCWNINPINGEANYDIDNEHKPELFEVTIKKIDKFKKELREWLLSQGRVSNIDILEFTYFRGHIPKHAFEEVKLMKKEGVINYDGRSPMITYDNFKKNNVLYINKL